MTASITLRGVNDSLKLSNALLFELLRYFMSRVAI